MILLEDELPGPLSIGQVSFKTDATRKLSNFNSQWTKTLFQNNLKNTAFFFYIFQGLKRYLVICNNTKDYFSWESEKMNVKFHKDCENTGKILKISCVRCNFMKFDIHFLGLPWEIFFGVITDD